MTIVFQGHVAEMKSDGANVELTIQTPMVPCGGKPFMVSVPASDAKHWIPGRAVSFTIYSLAEPEPTE